MKTVQRPQRMIAGELTEAIDEDQKKDIDVALTMEKRISGTVEFTAEPLTKVLDAFADRLKVVIEVDWDALKDQKVEPQTLVTIRQSNATADKVLTAILEKTNPAPRSIGYGIRNGAIFISEFDASQISVTHVYILEDETLRPALYEQKLYSVQGGVAPPVSEKEPSDTEKVREQKIEQLMAIIQGTVDVDTWHDNGGSRGGMRYFNGRLVITQTLKDHLAIRKLLKKLGVHARLAALTDWEDESKPAPKPSPAESGRFG